MDKFPFKTPKFAFGPFPGHPSRGSNPVMIIAQITDTHIREGRALLGPVDPAACLERAVAAVNALSPRPDLVILTGDIGNDGTPGEYAIARSILDRLAMPLYVIPGNHDTRAAMREAFGDITPFADGSPFLQYRIEAGPIRVLALDTLIEGRPEGRLCAERLRWLEAELEDAGDTPVLVAMHHPPVKTGIEGMDAIRLLSGARELEAILVRYPNVERIVAGHLHRAIQRRFAGTVVSLCPGVAHQLHLDLGQGSELALTAEPPGYQLHLVDDDGAVTTHTCVLGDFGPPVTFASIFMD